MKAIDPNYLIKATTLPIIIVPEHRKSSDSINYRTNITSTSQKRKRAPANRGVKIDEH